MKIRHKQSGVELEGEFFDAGNDFKEPSSRMFGESFYSKEHWDAVEPKWVAVSGECELLSGERVYHGASCVSDLRFGYRFRKIFVGSGYAFIIERKEST